MLTQSTTKGDVACIVKHSYICYKKGSNPFIPELASGCGQINSF